MFFSHVRAFSIVVRVMALAVAVVVVTQLTYMVSWYVNIEMLYILLLLLSPSIGL